MTIATRLAQKITAFSYDMLPDDAVHWAKVGLLDTIGVTLAGANESAVEILNRMVPDGPRERSCLVFGRRRSVAPLDAAMINATAAHALDFDDCSNSLGGHPSAPVLPPLLALAELEDVTGRDLMTAYVAGFETETRISRGVNFHHYEKGWHPTATLGVFGAAAAASRLLRLDENATAMALALSASFASGIKASFGTMAKPLQVGQAARNGLMAALLARDGFTAALDAFEHRQGFLMLFNGEGLYDAASILRDWASPLDIVRPGLAIKQYPCCGSTHPVLDAMLGLVAEHDLEPSMVRHVEAWTHPRRLAHTNRPDPRSGLDAKFSTQYCLARALMHGKVAIDHFEGDAYLDPEVRKVMARIEAAPHPEMSMGSTDHFGGEVRILLEDGRELASKVDLPLGRSTDNPLPLALLEAKFVGCASRALTDEVVADLTDLIWRFDELERLKDLLELIRAGTRAPD